VPEALGLAADVVVLGAIWTTDRIDDGRELSGNRETAEARYGIEGEASLK
jgi:hypothetical protein